MTRLLIDDGHVHVMMEKQLSVIAQILLSLAIVQQHKGMRHGKVREASCQIEIVVQNALIARKTAIVS